MTKLDWTRTAEGRDGYDTALAREWSSGPSGASFERPDGEDALKLLSAPTIYWAKELSIAYPAENDEAHVALFMAARRASETLYRRNGWAAIRSRVQAIHAKASILNPFPSSFYAIYFDYWAMIFARVDHRQRLGGVPRHVESFSNSEERWVRALPVLRAIEKQPGRSDLKGQGGLNTWLESLYEKMKAKQSP
jgi:hypothetical protein